MNYYVKKSFIYREVSFMAGKRIAQIQELIKEIEVLQSQIVDEQQLISDLKDKRNKQEDCFNQKLSKLEEKHNAEVAKLNNKKQQIQNNINKTEEKSLVLSTAYNKKIESLKKKIKTYLIISFFMIKLRW